MKIVYYHNLQDDSMTVYERNIPINDMISIIAQRLLGYDEIYSIKEYSTTDEAKESLMKIINDNVGIKDVESKKNMSSDEKLIYTKMFYIADKDTYKLYNWNLHIIAGWFSQSSTIEVELLAVLGATELLNFDTVRTRKPVIFMSDLQNVKLKKASKMRLPHIVKRDRFMDELKSNLSRRRHKMNGEDDIFDF